ncbi:Glutathione transport system permease protein GsiC [subsurface metagenome]|jgi:peptide/nickel transport system permease protein
MRAYIIRRVLLMVPTLFLVSVIIFLLIRIVPGDAINAMEARMAQTGSMGEINRVGLEKALGLDVPILTQYGRWIGVVPQADGRLSGVLQGDLGRSYWKPYTVMEEIARRWPVTFELGLMALIVAQLIALPVGIFSALRQDTWGDYIARSFAIMCIAVPGFWLATLAIVFPSIWWGHMPPVMLIPFTEDPIGNLGMFIVPAIVLGMAMSGMTMRMTRTMMLEVLRQDYIRTAWAKGLRERVVIIRHALKNALIPVITLMGLQLPVLIGGAVLIEQIFVLPGMGFLIISSITERDYPVLGGTMLLFGAGMMFFNLIVDLTYGFLDPRIRYR